MQIAQERPGRSLSVSVPPILSHSVSASLLALQAFVVAALKPTARAAYADYAAHG